MEMICAIVYQLTKDLTPEEIEKYGFELHHTLLSAGFCRPAGSAPAGAL